MKKARLTKILVEGRSDLLRKFSLQVEANVPVQLESPPTIGSIMMKARDSVSMQPFYMGEILVTECTVSIQGYFGLGMIKGEELEKAYQLAVIDAAFNANLPFTEAWITQLEKEEEKIANRQQEEAMLAKQTKVQFDTMEDYNDKS